MNIVCLYTIFHYRAMEKYEIILVISVQRRDLESKMM